MEDAIGSIYEITSDATEPARSSQSQLALGHLDLRLKAESMFLDLRCQCKNSAPPVALAVKIPLHPLTPDTTNPFYDPITLEHQWTELDSLYGPKSHPEGPSVEGAELRGKRVYLLCWTGETSRVCSSIMRANGVEAFSVGGGFQAIQQACPHIIDSRGGAIMQC